MPSCLHLASHDASRPPTALCGGVGRGPVRVRAYICMNNYTDQENEVLTTRITYNTYTPCVTQMRVSYRS